MADQVQRGEYLGDLRDHFLDQIPVPGGSERRAAGDAECRRAGAEEAGAAGAVAGRVIGKSEGTDSVCDAVLARNP